MKKLKRTVAFMLIICIFASLMPPTPLAQAAEVVQRYELDTDGIDVGATYLIVNTTTAGSGNALRFYYNNSWSRDLRNQTLTVETEDDIKYISVGFENEADCQFQFTSATAGNITHSNYKLDLSNNGFASNNSSTQTLTFNHLGNGQYQVYYNSWWRNYYLRYNNSDWSNSTTTASVYLYKLTEHVLSYDLAFDGNGYTFGQLPSTITDIGYGEEIVLPFPTDVRKDIDEDTWLFLCWNTKPDGSGIEYNPGDKITITGDMTLYVDWYQQTKHTVSMVTYLDGVPTDVDKFAGYDRHFYAVLEGGDGSYIALTHRDEGVYSAKVTENGTYTIYAITADGQYEPVHGHQVVVYNLNGMTECLHYTVTYDIGGGQWAEGEAPDAGRWHYGETVYSHNKIPTREGYRFVGWVDQNNNPITPGHPITEFANEKMTLTAVWEKLVDVTFQLVLDHNSADGGVDPNKNKHEVHVTLLREENGVNTLVEEITLTEGFIDDSQANTTTYTLLFKNQLPGTYHIRANKDYYVQTSDHQDDGHVNVTLKYTPEDSNLYFDVVVNAENEAEKALMPIAANVKVSCWGYNKDGELGWHIITQQEEPKVPSTVVINKETGTGTGSFTIWTYRTDSEAGEKIPYEYRVEVTSFVLPDGTVVKASGDHETYTPNGSGLYTATVSVEGDGRAPTYGGGSTLEGAYFVEHQQMGVPTVTVDINPMTVTFDAGEGEVNGEKTIVLENQYRYPALHDYTAIPDDADLVFLGWGDKDYTPVENMEGQLLTGNVTYYARYNKNITLSGTVFVDTVYEQDGQIVNINAVDRAKAPVVVLEKKLGDAWNDIASYTATLTYPTDLDNPETMGTAYYEFKDLPNDGTEYRVHVLTLNYNGSYDNDLDGVFSAEEFVAQIDTVNAKAEVNIHLDFAPDAYEQAVHVDVSQIHEDLRPTKVLMQILYRDLGNVHNYNVISQHMVSPYGLQVDINAANAAGMGFYDAWNWHTNGTLYEYQAQVYKAYGNNVEGAYSQEGTEYTQDSPYTVVYGAPNNYIKQITNSGVTLEATLVPKKYPVHLDLNLGTDNKTPVLGLEKYMVDDDTGNDRYVFVHTWSYAEQFTAYPYREGYVFKGWVSSDENDVYIREDGVINVGNTVDHAVTLTAQWEKLESTDYSIRYLELNTDKVLKGATVVRGAAAGDAVVAAERADAIEGYVYAGAWVDGVYIEREDNPVLTVTTDPAKNLMVIYYLPDGSDGYTEQVESNLEINKTAVLEDDGTYTITMDTWTKDNPITTLIQQNTPLDIVLVLDQSGSLAADNYAYLTALQGAVDNFIESVADHGRHNEIDHRIAIVGYAGDASDVHSSDPVKATGGKTSDSWINTGVFDSNGEYHLYNVNGFNYKKLENNATINPDGIYYIKVTTDGEDHYLLLSHHDEYRHLITEEQARVAVLQGETVFGYVYDEMDQGKFVELTRNSSGLWLYGNKKLYSQDEFFTYHTDVWTYRNGLDPRQIHAYGVGAAYAPVDNQKDVYTRGETTDNSYEHDIYKDALVPVSLGAAGSGGTNPGLLKATQSLGADGATRASYGMEMANEILKANPVDDGEGRVRLVVMFTDGEPGYMGFTKEYPQYDYYEQAVNEANSAIKHAYTAKNTYGAYVYTIGLYESAGVEATSEVAYYMNALSSNYPNAKSMDDIKAAVSYVQAPADTALENNGKFYVRHRNSGSNYYEVKYGYVSVSGSWGQRNCWYYNNGSNNYSISTAAYPTVNSDGRVGSFNIYTRTGGYQETPNSGYYATTESSDYLKGYFEDVLYDITTKITTEIVLESDTILRDIMNQGLVMTDGTVITVYTQEGNYNLDTKEVNWVVDANGDPVLDEKVRLELNTGKTSAEGLSPGLDENGNPRPGVKIITYNLDAANPTDPSKTNYAPHTVDITGYDFHNWYISETNTKGYKMIVTITRVEAMDNVQWSRSTTTNHERSGLWLPADESGSRQLLLPFDQPTTIFVERAYVLDYGEEFALSGWYFDDEDGQDATPIHLDLDISNGMNYFDTPNTQNTVGGSYGNTKYGNVEIRENADGEETVYYRPTTMQWGGMDQFYVFGETWRRTVVAQDANENGNLWNKVTVIPANNIYYEDSFITTDSTTQNGIEGFTFSDNWTTVGTDSNNTEIPEHLESAPYGDVHGWTDSLHDDKTHSDGTAHYTKTPGAYMQFTFTGTGAEVYTRTNATSGMAVAVLYTHSVGDDGQVVETQYQSFGHDNQAVSGDYYHRPTMAFKNLPYGTYTMKVYATMAVNADGSLRYDYYVDGVRIHNPLGNATNYQSSIIKDAYGLENNAVFTEVRDILIDTNNSFNADQSQIGGAVFIDEIKPGQGTENDTPGVGVPTYEIATFKEYGPKNEVYLSAGQAIVLKVAEGNTYYMGMSSMTGSPVTVNVSGVHQTLNPTSIIISHTTDMYYRVNPVDGYIVIQNANTDGAILSITNLRTTNMHEPVVNGGIVSTNTQAAMMMMRRFSAGLLEQKNNPTPDEPTEETTIPSVQEQTEETLAFASSLFLTVRRWLDTE